MADQASLVKAATRKSHSRRDVFHAWLVEGAEFVGAYDIPALKPVDARPERLVPFSKAMGAARPDPETFVHFYEDDYRFERLWNNPKAYVARLSCFAGVIMPDFSICVDFPEALKIWNTYRNFALASWLQSQGLTVVPNVRNEPGSDEYSLKPVPKTSTIAIGTHGCVKRRDDRRRLARDIRHAIDYCEPTRVLVYGSDAYGVLDYVRSTGVETMLYPASCRDAIAEDR